MNRAICITRAWRWPTLQARDACPLLCTADNRTAAARSPRTVRLEGVATAARASGACSDAYCPTTQVTGSRTSSTAVMHALAVVKAAVCVPGPSSGFRICCLNAVSDSKHTGSRTGCRSSTSAAAARASMHPVFTINRKVLRSTHLADGVGQQSLPRSRTLQPRLSCTSTRDAGAARHRRAPGSGRRRGGGILFGTQAADQGLSGSFVWFVCTRAPRARRLHDSTCRVHFKMLAQSPDG